MPTGLASKLQSKQAPLWSSNSCYQCLYPKIP